jgi:hypothetical protein
MKSGSFAVDCFLAFTGTLDARLSAARPTRLCHTARGSAAAFPASIPRRPSTNSVSILVRQSSSESLWGNTSVPRYRPAWTRVVPQGGPTTPATVGTGQSTPATPAADEQPIPVVLDGIG